jgi:hypothetical protein
LLLVDVVIRYLHWSHIEGFHYKNSYVTAWKNFLETTQTHTSSKNQDIMSLKTAKH